MKLSFEGRLKQPLNHRTNKEIEYTVGSKHSCLQDFQETRWVLLDKVQREL